MRVVGFGFVGFELIRVWLSLRTENENQRRLVLLGKNTIFRVARDFHFKVTERAEAEKVEDCLGCDRTRAEAVLRDCRHVCLCLSCVRRLKKCPVKNCKGTTQNYDRVLYF